MTRVSFGEGELLELLRIAIQQNDIETSASYFLKDAKKSLCLMQEDGVYTSFVHRSFQEYFTAKFLHAYGGERYEFLVDEVVTRSFSDNTYLMLCQLNAHDVLRRWAMPRIGRLIAEIDVVLAADDDAVSKFIKSYVSRIMFNPENGVIGNHAWVATSKVEAVHAINLALEIAGVAHSIVGLRGNVYPNGEISQASKTILQRADWEEEEDDRGDIVETGNKEMSVMHLNKDAISGSGIRNAILNLREELVTGRGEIEKKINIADNFAAEVNVIFGQNRV
jgi:hypothetical protein